MKKYFTLFVALGTTTSLATACHKKTEVKAQQKMQTTTKTDTKKTSSQNRQLHYNKNKYYYDVANLPRKPLIVNKIVPVVKVPLVDEPLPVDGPLPVDEPLPVDVVPKNVNPIQEDGGALKNLKKIPVEDEERKPVVKEPVVKEPVITKNLDGEIIDYFVDENDHWQKTFDENGNLLDHQITKDGKTTWINHKYHEIHKNKKAITTNSEGDVTTYTYDKDGNLLSTVDSKAEPAKKPDLTVSAEDKAKEEKALAEVQKWLSTNPELVKPGESKEDKEYLEKATLDVKDSDKTKDTK